MWVRSTDLWSYGSYHNHKQIRSTWSIYLRYSGTEKEQTESSDRHKSIPHIIPLSSSSSSDRAPPLSHPDKTKKPVWSGTIGGVCFVCSMYYVHLVIGGEQDIVSHVAMWMQMGMTMSLATRQPPPHPSEASFSEQPASCCCYFHSHCCCCCYCLLLQVLPHHAPASVAGSGPAQDPASSSSGTGFRKRCIETAIRNWKIRINGSTHLNLLLQKG